jgi:multicomponent K+:H+ antiporter subunit D
VSSLLLIVAAGRTGTRLLWSGPHRHDDDEPHRRETAAERRRRPDRWKLSCAAFLLAGNVGMVLFAGPVSQYLDATAAQLLDRQAWRDAVLPYGQSGPPGLPGKPGIRRAEGSKP